MRVAWSGPTAAARRRCCACSPATERRRARLKAAALKILLTQMRELEEGVTLRARRGRTPTRLSTRGAWCMSPATRRSFCSPVRAQSAYRRLCGGERARVLIAKLMLEPADLLLLDEPTNDLDIATLGDFGGVVCSSNTGALVLVTHDRLHARPRLAVVLDSMFGNAETLQTTRVGAVAARTRLGRTVMAARRMRPQRR